MREHSEAHVERKGKPGEMVLISLGANLPTLFGALATCRAAAAALDGIAGLRLAAVSGWYETEAVPPSGQPPYVNGVARLAGGADPAVLLRALHAMELAHGRERSVPNAARTLDLDIIAMGSLVRAAPDPVLPHPRMHARAFVLRPLLDVAPDWRHPVLGASARFLLDGLPDQGVKPCSHLRDGRPGLI